MLHDVRPTSLIISRVVRDEIRDKLPYLAPRLLPAPLSVEVRARRQA